MKTKFLSIISSATWPVLALFTACLAPIPSTAEPLLVAVEVHVEHSGCPPDQRRMVESISQAAAAQRLRVTFGFGRKFFQCTDVTEQHAIVSQVLADGHAATLHADLEPDAFVRMLASLSNQAAQLHRIGGDPAVSSGVCTSCPWACDDSQRCPQFMGWVEAARTAGIQAVAGVVQYCYLSLDPSGRYGHLYRKTCTDPSCGPPAGDPSTCHAHVPENERERLAPWKTETTAAWMRDDGSGLLIIPTYPDVPPHCFFEVSQGITNPRACSFNGAVEGTRDAEALADVIRKATNLLGRSKRGAFHMVWSTNTLSDDDYIGGFFQALGPAIYGTAVPPAQSGEVTFVTLPQLVNAYR